ncbi:cyclic nucleotide-binding domain-containing protein [Marinicauda algicola]|uniref:Cyclic nucleotide-binding domain-containing protein n=1 Tax=Marinicauda algicola TaxID=2029849 RepID=A0A4S2H373_9PROT|nr:patatin-like phospholipase family protein [Marinicauda algicola]TGY89692.1 cyclic nucleotide-binding domain-containing protein [Marinicauda algicola]
MPPLNLGFLPFLNRVEKAALKAVEAEVEWFCLPAGETLFEAGEPADAFYLVRSGALAAFKTGADGRPELVGHIRQGEPVGEMALVEDRPHTASVYALRDSELVRLPKATFHRLTRKHASLMNELARMMLYRLRGGELRARTEPKVFALIATSPTIDLDARAEQLQAALARLGLKSAILDVESADWPGPQLDAYEADHDVVFLCAKLSDALWARRAMGRADRIWVLARADAKPSTPLMPDDASPAAKLKLIDVVMLHHGGDRPGLKAAPWVEAADAARCFHLRQGHEEDYHFLARIVAGRSVGLVLSGGGSRAYAHVGAIRAFREAGVVFDVTGGASMGGIIAAGLAMGWSQDELEDRLYRAFVETSPLNDWTLPVVAMTKGRKVDRRLAEHFGDVEIEDLKRPFFCVSSNLKDASVHVHRTGLVRQALRASIAVPGLLPPVTDGENVYVDGAVFSNFPATQLKALHRGCNIGCDVTRNIGLDPKDFLEPKGFFEWVLTHGFSEPPPVASLLMRAATVGVLERHESVREEVDLLVLPELEVELREWKRFDEAVEAGYRAATELLRNTDAETVKRLKAGSAKRVPSA